MTFIVLVLQGCNPFGSNAEVSAPVGANNSSGGSGGGSSSDNTAPTVGADQTETGTEDIAVTFTINAGSDADGDSLTYSVVSAPSNGTLTNCMDQSGADSASDLTCTYTQTTADANGSPFDTFTYKVNDGTTDSTTNATVTINLTAASEAFSKTWDFLTSGDYTYTSNYIEVTAGAANLRTVDIKTDTESNFDAGTYVGTDYSSSRLTLANNGGCDATTRNCSGELDSSWTPQWANLVGYWKLDESSWDGTANEVVDSSGNSNHGVRVGNATTTSTAKIGGYAGTFDGTGDYVDLGSDAITSTGNVTVAYWFKSSNTSTTQGHISIVNTGQVNTDYMQIGVYNNFLLASGDNSEAASKKSSRTLANNTWYHIAVVKSTAQIDAIYVNGVESSEASGVGELWGSDNIATWLGGANAVTDRSHLGEMDEVAIWSVALSASEVKQVYDRQSAKYSGTYTSEVFNLGASGTITNFFWTPDLPYFKELASSNEAVANYVDLVDSTGASGDGDLSDNLAGYWRFNESSWTIDSAGDVVDSSSNTNNGEAKGNAAINSNGKFGNGGYFDGSGDYIDLGSDASIKGITGSMTMSAWIKGTSGSANGNSIMGTQGGSGNRGFTMGPANNGTFYCSVAINATSQVQSNVAGANDPSDWEHWVCVYNSTAQTLEIFKNGVSRDTRTSANGVPTSQYTGSAYSVKIGNRGDGIGSFVGRIDEVALWSRALADNEVVQLYQRGANRVKFQVRSCDDAACSGETWVGPDNSSSTYFTELLNCSSIASAACSGTVNNTLPFMLFSDFTSPGANQYFQYRAILESDDENTLCSGGASTCYPEISNVSLFKRSGDVVGGAEQDWYWMGTTTIVNTTAQSFDSLTSLSITEGGSCPQRYQVSNDGGTTYYYYNGTSWATSSNETTHVSTKAQIEAGVSSLAVGSGSFKLKTIFSSDGSQACSISNADLVGTEP